jgi:hypothetical protein
MSTDYQRSMQTASPSPMAYPVSRDILVIVALVLCLLAGSWASFHFCYTFVLHSLGRTVIWPSVAMFLLSTAKGLFHFLCGYWLARLLRRVNPWYVLAGLAVVAALFLLALAGFRPHLDFRNSRSVIPVPFFLAFDVFGENCLLLFLALGIWYQRRMKAVRGEGIEQAEVSTNAHLPSQTTDCCLLKAEFGRQFCPISCVPFRCPPDLR